MDNIKTIPCPNNIPGCCVLHLATEEVATHPAESKNIGEGIIQIYDMQGQSVLNRNECQNAINVTNNKCNCFAELSSMTTTEATLIKNEMIKALNNYNTTTITPEWVVLMSILLFLVAKELFKK